jgi:hypothetical protein
MALLEISKQSLDHGEVAQASRPVGFGAMVADERLAASAWAKT